MGYVHPDLTVPSPRGDRDPDARGDRDPDARGGRRDRPAGRHRLADRAAVRAEALAIPWWQALLIGGVGWLVLVLATTRLAGAILPAAIVVGALLLPVAYACWLDEHREHSLGPRAGLRAMAAGAVLGVVAGGLLETRVSASAPAYFLVALIEEAAKLLVVVTLATRTPAAERTTRRGLALGGAVGVGFGAFQVMAYAFGGLIGGYAGTRGGFDAAGPAVQSQLLRIALTPAGQALTGAILAGAVFAASRARTTRRPDARSTGRPDARAATGARSIPRQRTGSPSPAPSRVAPATPPDKTPKAALLAAAPPLAEHPMLRVRRRIADAAARLVARFAGFVRGLVARFVAFVRRLAWWRVDAAVGWSFVGVGVLHALWDGASALAADLTTTFSPGGLAVRGYLAVPAPAHLGLFSAFQWIGLTLVALIGVVWIGLLLRAAGRVEAAGRAEPADRAAQVEEDEATAYGGVR